MVPGLTGLVQNFVDYVIDVSKSRYTEQTQPNLQYGAVELLSVPDSISTDTPVHQPSFHLEKLLDGMQGGTPRICWNSMTGPSTSDVDLGRVGFGVGFPQELFPNVLWHPELQASTLTSYLPRWIANEPAWGLVSHPFQADAPMEDFEYIMKQSLPLWEICEGSRVSQLFSFHHSNLFNYGNYHVINSFKFM